MPAQYQGNATTKAARAKSGGGYESAIEVVSGTPAISSVTDNGDGTLSISGSGFGAKAQAAPILWDCGKEVYENGVKNTYREGLTDSATINDAADQTGEVYVNAGWRPKLITSSRPLRYAGATGHYVGDNTQNATGESFMEKPLAANGDNPTLHDKHYEAWWIKYHYHFLKLHKFVYANKSGEFNLPDLIADPEALGEQVTLSNGEEAYILRDTGTHVCIYTPNSTSRMEELGGTTVTGQTSGQTFDIVTDPGGQSGTDDWDGPEKLCRIWNGGGSAANNDFRYTWNRDSSSTVGTGGTTAYTPHIHSAGRAEPGTWALLECMVDLENSRVVVAVNGLATEMDISGYVYTEDTGLYLAEIGWQQIRALYNIVEYGEIYLDHTFQRVYLGDAATWGACTKRELQRPTAWSSSAIDVAKKQGSISGQAYAYVIASDWPDSTTEGVAV